MDPLGPNPEESKTLPVRRKVTDHGEAPPGTGNTASADLGNAALPAEASTLSLRAGQALNGPAATTPPLPDPGAAGEELRTLAFRPAGPAQSALPPTAPPPTDATVSIRQVQAARPTVKQEPPADPKLPEGATVSIRQVLDLRAKMAASWDEPTEVEDSAGTTTVPVKPKERPGSKPSLFPTPAEPDQPPKKRSGDMLVSAPPPAGQPKKRSGDIPVDPAALCPRCGQKLISPMSLGLCPGCGYCKSLEEGKDKVAPPPEAKPQRLSMLGLVEFWMLLTWVPLWAWTVLAGVVLIVLQTVYARRMFAEDTLLLDWWGSIQFGIGIVALIGAHVWALFQLAPEDGRVGPFDLLALSFRIWGKVIEYLPTTGAQLALAILGGVGAVAALFLCGVPFSGLDKPSEGYITRELRAALDNLKRPERDALVSQASKDLSSRPKPPPNSAPEQRDDRRPTEKVAVVGYRVNEDGSVVEVALATVRDGVVRYAGVVRVKADEVLQSLRGMERDPNAGPGGDAVWVKPGGSVEVHHSGTDGDGKLQDPNFKRLLPAADKN